MISTVTSIALKITNKTLSYDPINDFKIIGPISTAPVVLAVRKDNDMNTITDFIITSKTNRLNCGAAGTFVSLYVNYLVKNNNLDNVVVVPYKSTPQPAIDLLSGNLDCFCTVLPTVMENPNMKILRGESKIKFNTFTAIAIGNITNEELIKNVLVDMNSDKEFVAMMRKRGYDVPKIDFDYNKTLEREYQFLDHYNVTHNIIEVIR